MILTELVTSRIVKDVLFISDAAPQTMKITDDAALTVVAGEGGKSQSSHLTTLVAVATPQSDTNSAKR